MWPWEHLAFGYVLFSLLARIGRHVEPGEASVYLLGLFTQFPDLVDKPLAWSLGILRSGVSVGHSVFVALSISVVALALGHARGRTTAGLAVAVGYLSHLLGDLLYPVVTGEPFRIDAILWPLVRTSSIEGTGLVSRVRYLLGNLEVVLVGEYGVLYVGLELTLLATALALWYADGCPGVRPIGARLVRRRQPR